jgi:hypothetical protein
MKHRQKQINVYLIFVVKKTKPQRIVNTGIFKCRVLIILKQILYVRNYISYRVITTNFKNARICFCEQFLPEEKI